MTMTKLVEKTLIGMCVINIFLNLKTICLTYAVIKTNKLHQYNTYCIWNVPHLYFRYEGDIGSVSKSNCTVKIMPLGELEVGELYNFMTSNCVAWIIEMEPLT